MESGRTQVSCLDNLDFLTRIKFSTCICGFSYYPIIIFFVKMLSRKNSFGVVNFINYTQHKEIATDIDKVQGNRYIFSLLYPIYYKGIAA